MAPSLSRVHWRTLKLEVLNLPVLQPDRYLSAGGLGGCLVMVLSNPE